VTAGPTTGAPETTIDPNPGDEHGTRMGSDGTMIVAGRYEIDLASPLGSGGMAIVYRGRDLRTRRSVAVRTLRTEYRTNPASRAAFRQETRNQALATHGNIARIFDLHEEQEAPWAVMELVSGQTLRELLNSHGPYPPSDAADLLDQVASALAYLHGRGMVHLDVKPENLIVAPDGTVKLIDFGLAQPLGRPAEPIGGAAFGTAAYLSPEQITGDRVDAAADVYTLACVMYEVLTGSPPFGGVALDAANMAEGRNVILRAHLDTVPDAPSLVRPDLDLPAALDDVVLWALAKRPTERYTDVTAFARLFRGAIEPLSLNATTVPLAQSHDRLSSGGWPTDPPAEHLPYIPARTANEARLRWSDQAPRPVLASLVPQVIDSEAVGYPAAAPTLATPVAQSAQPVDAIMQPAFAPAREPTRGVNRRLRRFLARLVLVAIFAGLVLVATLIVTRGAAEVLPGQPAIARNVTVEIQDDLTNVRSGPGTSNPAITSLAAGTKLTVDGDARRDSGGMLWWPVISLGGDGTNGFVRADGIRAVPKTWYERVSVRTSDAIDGFLDPIRESIPNL
jgi:serine/threonine protein kinase